VQSGIPFQALCAHHFLPFFGHANIGYIPRNKVVGLSKLARLVFHAGRLRPTIQEQVTDLIADTLVEATDCAGAIVTIRAVHTCMTVRGIKAESAVTTTSALRGIFREVPAARQEFLALIQEAHT
jgi:GTP cyclohydrolase I